MKAKKKLAFNVETFLATANGWTESGGPSVAPPKHRGFGTRVVKNIIRDQLRGEVHFDWRDQGLACEIALLLA